MTDQTNNWSDWLYKQSVTTVLLVGFAMFVGWYLVIPLRDYQAKMTDSVIAANKTNSEANRTNATTISKISDNQSNIVATQQIIMAEQKAIVTAQYETMKVNERMVKVLEDIRTDQRKFPAVAERIP
jgi:hypothetical protein